MFKRIILAIILSVSCLLVFFGFKSDLLPLEYLIITGIFLFFAYIIKNKFPLFSKIIFILIGSLIPAYAIGIIVLLATLFIFTWGSQSMSVPCDMGGRGIIGLIFGIMASIGSYFLIVIISFLYFRRRKFPPLEIKK